VNLLFLISGLEIDLKIEDRRLHMRIVAAMSGGVDSSVAAALLAEQGHDVIGLSMQLYPSTGSGQATDGDQTFGRCCTLDDLNDARRVASAIGIPHYIINFERQFQETVISNFVREYASGRTPLPCAHCNSDLKFSTLLDRARGFGAEHVATGHYARVGRAADGRWLLRRSADAAKDQSYFLFSLTQQQLSRAAFPVGELTKPEVREQARRLGLSVAEKPDSQEICFVPDGDYAAFVAKKAPAVEKVGAIVDTAGQVLGNHGGVHRFTVGQRKGLGIAAPAPLYVLGIDAESGSVTVGPRAALEQTTLTAADVNWIAIDAPSEWTPVSAQIRHRHRPASGCVRAGEDGRAEFVFDEPQAAITPGQAVVFYDGDVVVGGGWIQSAGSVAAESDATEPGLRT
jgi:tRNA-specific 2-thiouridylase